MRNGCADINAEENILIPPSFSNALMPRVIFRCWKVIEANKMALGCEVHTLSLTFRHLSPNSARTGYATEWALQTPSTALQHPSFFGGGCRKAMLGVCGRFWSPLLCLLTLSAPSRFRYLIRLLKQHNIAEART